MVIKGGSIKRTGRRQAVKRRPTKKNNSTPNHVELNLPTPTRSTPKNRNSTPLKGMGSKGKLTLIKNKKAKITRSNSKRRALKGNPRKVKVTKVSTWGNN